MPDTLKTVLESSKTFEFTLSTFLMILKHGDKYAIIMQKARLLNNNSCVQYRVKLTLCLCTWCALQSEALSVISYRETFRLLLLPEMRNKKPS